MAQPEPLWSLYFEAYEWCADPVITSPLWSEPVNLWLSSAGEIELASGCCGVQLNPQPADRLQPPRWACLACGATRPQVRISERKRVMVTDTRELKLALVEWIEPIGDSPHTETIAEELSASLIDAWKTKLEVCYGDVESREAEQEAWARLKVVAEAIELESPTLVSFHG